METVSAQINIPKDLHKKLRRYSLDKNIPGKTIIIKALEQYLKK